MYHLPIQLSFQSNYINISVYMHIHIHIYTCIHVHVYTLTSMYVHIYLCILAFGLGETPPGCDALSGLFSQAIAGIELKISGLV